MSLCLYFCLSLSVSRHVLKLLHYSVCFLVTDNFLSFAWMSAFLVSILICSILYSVSFLVSCFYSHLLPGCPSLCPVSILSVRLDVLPCLVLLFSAFAYVFLSVSCMCSLPTLTRFACLDIHGLVSAVCPRPDVVSPCPVVR